MTYRNAQPWKGAVAGLTGGTVGTIAIGVYWKALNALLGKDLRKQKSQKPGALDDMAVGGIAYGLAAAAIGSKRR